MELDTIVVSGKEYEIELEQKTKLSCQGYTDGKVWVASCIIFGDKLEGIDRDKIQAKTNLSGDLWDYLRTTKQDVTPSY